MNKRKKTMSFFELKKSTSTLCPTKAIPSLFRERERRKRRRSERKRSERKRRWGRRWGRSWGRRLNRRLSGGKWRGRRGRKRERG